MSRPANTFHQIDSISDLTLPAPGSTTARNVLSLAVRRLLFDLKELGLRAAPLLGKDAPAFQHLIAHALKHAPGALASALRLPTLAALVRCLRAPSQASQALCVELFALLALELSRQNSLDTPVVLQGFSRPLLCLGGHFCVHPPPDTRALSLENGRVLLDRGAGINSIELKLNALDGHSEWISFPYHRIENSLVLALEDNNPLAMLEAHPNKSGNAIDLGDHPVSEWVQALKHSLALIQRRLPDLRREIDLFVYQFVPVGFDHQRHVSASYQEAIGTLYLSLHPNPMTMTEAVIHEFSHNKLNALFELDDVLENAWSPLYTSPVRPDPRPLHGIVLAAHAFLPVAALYRAMRDAGDPLAQHPSFQRRFDQIRALNHEAVRVLSDHAKPTPVGLGLLKELERLDQFDQMNS